MSRLTLVSGEQMAKKRIAEVDEAFGADPDELAEQEERDATAALSEAPMAAPADQVAPLAAAPLSMTVADIQAIVKTAVEAAQGGNQQIAEIVTQGIAQARKPIPEGTDHSNPRISEANPLGERDHPKPGLKCEVTFGIQDPKSKQIQRTYPFDEDDLTVYEQIALNTLPTKGEYQVKLHDGSPIKLSIVPETDQATDALKRLVLVIPQHVTQRGSAIKNMLPGAVNLVSQITGTDYGKLSLDDLEWFMAEHRAKRYVSEREGVAA